MTRPGSETDRFAPPPVEAADFLGSEADLSASAFFETLDRDGALAETAGRAAKLSRGGFLATVAASGGALLAARRAGAADGGLSKTDKAVLNYALVLEYLQASFYTEAERVKALRGDRAEAARVLGGVERAHVKAFKQVLGRAAVKSPSFDFQGTTEQPDAFLKTAVAFEDLAVAAYSGQATRLESRSALAAALSIHSVEARHAAWMRYLVGVDPAARAFDQPKPRREIDAVVRSTGFISTRPSTHRHRRPRYTG